MGKIIDDLKESTRNVNEINKANLKAEAEAARARMDEATEPNPDFEEFKAARGLKAKTKVVVDNIVKGAKANNQREKERREEIKSHEGYRTMLEEQREKREEAIKKSNNK